MTTKKKSKKPRTGRILTLPPTRLAPRSADLRSGAFRGAFEYLPGRRPALRGQCQDAVRNDDEPADLALTQSKLLTDFRRVFMATIKRALISVFDKTGL